MMDRTILDEMVHVDCLVPCTGSYKLLVWMDVWNGMVSGKIMFGWLYGFISGISRAPFCTKLILQMQQHN